jgi:hypothetical protein
MAPGSKSCRRCYLARLGTNERKFEAGPAFAALTRQLDSATRRAIRDDVEGGFAELVKFVEHAKASLDAAGTALVADRGPQHVADGLTMATGTLWVRRRTHKRWGGGTDDGN